MHLKTTCKICFTFSLHTPRKLDVFTCWTSAVLPVAVRAHTSPLPCSACVGGRCACTQAVSSEGMRARCMGLDGFFDGLVYFWTAAHGEQKREEQQRRGVYISGQIITWMKTFFPVLPSAKEFLGEDCVRFNVQQRGEWVGFITPGQFRLNEIKW